MKRLEIPEITSSASKSEIPSSLRDRLEDLSEFDLRSGFIDFCSPSHPTKNSADKSKRTNPSPLKALFTNSRSSKDLTNSTDRRAINHGFLNDSEEFEHDVARLTRIKEEDSFSELCDESKGNTESEYTLVNESPSHLVPSDAFIATNKENMKNSQNISFANIINSEKGSPSGRTAKQEVPFSRTSTNLFSQALNDPGTLKVLSIKAPLSFGTSNSLIEQPRFLAHQNLLKKKKSSSFRDQSFNRKPPSQQVTKKNKKKIFNHKESMVLLIC